MAIHLDGQSGRDVFSTEERLNDGVDNQHKTKFDRRIPIQT